VYQVIHGKDSYRFEEKILLPLDLSFVDSDKILQTILQSVHVALGINYWKLFCPHKLSFISYALSKRQADFWNIVYTKGLGEFYYKNNINFIDLVHFPYDELVQDIAHPIDRNSRSLVGIGGGKDSVVSSRILQKTGVQFDGFVVETQKKYSIVHKVIQALSIKEQCIQRTIDTQLFELNKQKNVFNGHVPVSMIYAFLGLLVAYLNKYTYIIVSNERSADEGNKEYLHTTINHQWSKSSEFEKLLQEYILHIISPDIYYFSLLRPYSELQIAKLFVQETKFHHIFSSCNKNFRITASSSRRWCGECPKCAFTFILVAAFCSKDTVLRIFGSNFLNNQKLFSVYRQLWGVEGFKPFECVGTPDEAVVAMSMIHENADFEDSIVMEEFISKILPNVPNIQKLKQDVFVTKKTSTIPHEFQKLFNYDT